MWLTVLYNRALITDPHASHSSMTRDGNINLNDLSFILIYSVFLRWIQDFGEEGMNLLLKHLREHRVKLVKK